MKKLKILDKITPHETSWVPIKWAIQLLTSAHENDKNMRRLESPVFANLLSAIDKIEANNRKLLNYGWVNFPLAYTQVIYRYFFFLKLKKKLPQYNSTIHTINISRSRLLLFLLIFLLHYWEDNFYYRTIRTMTSTLLMQQLATHQILLLTLTAQI